MLRLLSSAGRCALLAGLLGNAAGHAFIFAVLPSIGRALGLTDIQTGAMLSLGALALIAAAPAWGFAAERLGRKLVILIGLIGAATGLLALGVAIEAAIMGVVAGTTAFSLLLAIRIAQSLLTSGLLPGAQAYVADVTSTRERAGGMGHMGAAFGLGSIVGAGLAWAVASTSLISGFLALTGVLGISTWLVWRNLPEPGDRTGPVAPASARIPLRRIAPNLAITLAGVTTYSLMQQVTGLRLQDQFDRAPEQAAAGAGAILTGAALAMVFSQAVLVGRLGWPPRRLMRAGGGVAFAAMLALAAATSYWQMVAATMVFGLSLGLLLPGNLAALSLHTGAGAQAKVAGLNAIGQGLGMALGPITGAALHQSGIQIPYLAAAGLLAGICLLSFLTMAENATRNVHP